MTWGWCIKGHGKDLRDSLETDICTTAVDHSDWSMAEYISLLIFYMEVTSGGERVFVCVKCSILLRHAFLEETERNGNQDEVRLYFVLWSLPRENL